MPPSSTSLFLLAGAIAALAPTVGCAAGAPATDNVLSAPDEIDGNGDADQAADRTASTLSVKSGSRPDAVAPSAAAPMPQHEVDAEALVVWLGVSKVNTYGSANTSIVWAGNASRAETVCSTFVTLLFQHTYGWTNTTFRTWMGSSSPMAAAYHDAIVAASGFAPIRLVTDLRAGDIVAVKYPAGQATTGHVALAAGSPRLRSSTKPVVAGTVQYELDVIDSSASYHGVTDTRYQSDGEGGGIGKGVMRIYASPDGTIAGHTWSTSTASVYYSMPEQHVAVGRLTR